MKPKVLKKLAGEAKPAYVPRQGYPTCPRECARGCETCFGRLSNRANRVLAFYFEAWDAELARLEGECFMKGEKVIGLRKKDGPKEWYVIAVDKCKKEVRDPFVVGSECHASVQVTLYRDVRVPNSSAPEGKQVVLSWDSVARRKRSARVPKPRRARTGDSSGPTSPGPGSRRARASERRGDCSRATPRSPTGSSCGASGAARRRSGRRRRRARTTTTTGRSPRPAARSTSSSAAAATPGAP